jgi:xylan 1,4-beta-xylosidase
VPDDAPPTAENPVLPGCYPDPSICRVGDDYYLVTSTFEYFPGLPIFHSRDLVHWRQIGHAIDRPEQLDLSGVPSSGGLFAATLRHHHGAFYLVNTLVNAGDGVQGGNYLLTADDAAGPWSDPVWLTDAAGIDPSLFFDDDGRAWYVGTRPSHEPAWHGETDVWLRELDLTTLALTGPEQVLWHGALLGAVWAEGPHLYKVEGRYYLLAMRPYGGYHYNLGRETFLVPVTWEDGWPVFAPGEGHLSTRFVPPRLAAQAWPSLPVRDEFPGEELDPCWNALRGPSSSFATVRSDPDRLEVRLTPKTLADIGTPAFLGRRQQHRDVDLGALIDFDPVGGHEWAGLALRLSEDDHYVFVIAGEEPGAEPGKELVGSRRVLAVRRHRGVQEILASTEIGAGPARLTIRARGQDYRMGYAVGQEPERDLVAVDGRILDPAAAGAFVGVWPGLYATSNGRPTANLARVDWFEYRPA